MTVLLRAYATDLEIRSDGRTVEGVAVPYGQEASIGRGVVEVFTRGAFGGTDPARVPFTARHPESGDVLPIGPTVELRDDAAGLVGAWRVSKTSFGDDVLELIRDRALTGLSVGFKEVAGGNVWNLERTRVERRAALLHHVAAVPFPAYEDARVLAVRGEWPLPDRSLPLLQRVALMVRRA
jgi:HK97 family phage prohead protease